MVSRKIAKPAAATPWCQSALRQRKMPGSITMATASQKLRHASQDQALTGNQVEQISYQPKSGASSCAALRARRKFARVLALKGSSHCARSHEQIAGPPRPHCHSALPKLWSVPGAGLAAAASRNSVADCSKPPAIYASEPCLKSSAAGLAASQ